MEPSSSRRPRFAWGVLGWTLAASAFAFRTFYRPARAAVQRGYVERCAGGSGCVPSVRIRAYPDSTTVYALTSGKLAATSTGVSIASDREPVVVSYGTLRQIFVPNGADVGVGQAIGIADAIELAVVDVVRAPDGKITFRKIEPTAWLAARGLKISVEGAASSSSALWCTGGRKLVMPAQVASCGIKVPTPSNAMLLPVSVTTE
jgi:hypothetical protein